jgi:hypothetical protein
VSRLLLYINRQLLDEVGSSNTRPGDKSVTPWPGWDHPSELRFVRGYVINVKTGEALSSVIADVRRERGQ